MKEFSELGVTDVNNQLIGEKIKMNKILNKQIVIHDFTIKDSKYEKDGTCLYLQLETENERRVLFTRGSKLIRSLQQIRKEDFPFKATIVRKSDNGPYEFS